ncbi:nucleotidyltransferase family protein [Qipengyuania atrilutea]|uniref:Nucleotidyltransferase family protein n=1 Tax=Qipengyuania atrilutea TaxID=2744473 RepID=A0A850GYK9_9SPHN|nr:nucleotidyltransferase family protein [Actirhodobacter atriluteus]NVD44724.1 nucleotidyltransferase family protein [Actirhodobacter atriluteus]
MNGFDRTPDARTAIALLAAGLGSRFGGGKLDASIAGKPLGIWSVEAAEAAGFRKRILVVGPVAPSFAEGCEGWTTAVNEEPGKGLSGSIRAAVRTARKLSASRLVIALADMPLLTTRHLQAIASGDTAAFTAYPGGRPGVPAAFGESLFGRLEALGDDEGAAAIASEMEHALISPGDDTLLCDVDTPEDQAKIAQILGAT